MKKIAIVVASGVGSRMGLDIPKQFAKINVDYEDGISEEKEVLSYTLEAFQNHELIDEIYVVTLSEYKRHVIEESLDNNITKLKGVISGGTTVQESIKNGVFFAYENASSDDIFIVHDGVRPLVDEEILADVIDVCEKKGNAVTSLPYNEQIFIVDEEDNSVTKKFINRDKLRRVSTPQAYNAELLYNAYQRAFSENIGIEPPNYTNNMMVLLGYKLNLAKGSDRNIKLTTKPDITAFKAYKKDEYDRLEKERIYQKEKAKHKVK